MTARKPDQFQYDDIESKITAITHLMAAAQPIQDGQTMDADDFEVVGDRKAAALCGRPRVADQRQDKPLMFLDKLHGTTPRQSGNLSSFFVQRSIYFAYFGKDLSISCDAMQMAPEENSIHDISMRVGPAVGEACAGFLGLYIQMEVDGRVEDEYRIRL